jgi:sulfatase maturation enzyme AslB (radical SAM superfamily)
MVKPESYNTIKDLEDSAWLSNLKIKMNNNEWPDECQRCQQEELLGQRSIRENAIKRHTVLSSIRADYLIVGGILDNVCNSACQFCDQSLSTKIGSLTSTNYLKINNVNVFNNLPQDRIIELDINGGEPSNSKNYTHLLENLPPNVKIIRINTNASMVVKNIETLLQRNIKVIVTISFDGIGKVYEYVRWPIKWETFVDVVDQYRLLRKQYDNLSLDFWTTLCALNLANLSEIQSYAQEKEISHSYGYLKQPKSLDISYTNEFTMNSKHPGAATKENNQVELIDYIRKQDNLRKIHYKDYFQI